MLKIENTDVCGFDTAIRGMRNPMNSWEKSDSLVIAVGKKRELVDSDEYFRQIIFKDEFIIGDNDRLLMEKLAKAGTDHRKFMRMIVVYADVTAPLYWWKEYDTYKVGTVANSCSTMHKVHDKKFTFDDFSHEHLTPSNLLCLKNIIDVLNYERENYLEDKDKKSWWQMIQLLPTSYNQRRTLMLNYEVLANVYRSRRSHKLDEWHTFCDWVESLPESHLITGKENGFI